MNAYSKPPFIKDFVTAIRIPQWIKNMIIIVVGLVSLRPDSDLELATIRLAATFMSFSLAASSIYVLNDMLDVNEDRQHPIKRNRPVASGRLGFATLWIFLACALAASIALAASVGIQTVTLVLAYLSINFGYCYRLKHVAQVDVICITSGFTLRALAGAFAVGHSINFWLLAAVMFACMSLALMKRMKEIQALGTTGETRPALAGYDFQTVRRAHDMFVVLAVLSGVLFLEDYAKTAQQSLTLAACLTIISAALLVFLHRMHADSNGDPTAFLYQHKYLSAGAAVLMVTLLLLL